MGLFSWSDVYLAKSWQNPLYVVLEKILMRDRPSLSNHRAVAEAKLGRKLLPTEVVDHADEDKANNDPANLTAQDRGAHTARHNANRGLSKLRRALRTTQGKEKVIY